MPTKKEIQHFQNVAKLIAVKAGKLLLAKRHTAKTLKSKSDLLDIVTEADEASEKVIIENLTKHFPTHNIYSEESGDHKKKSPFRWTIDPLDGTKEYARGQSLFFVNLSLEYQNELVVGVVYNPPTQELYTAAKGLGAYFNETKLTVNNETELKKAMVCAHRPDRYGTKAEWDKAWKLIGELGWNTYRLRVAMNDVWHLCQIATGAYECLYIPHPTPHWWDIAVGILMVEEAGGTVTTLKNNPVTEESFKKEGLLASNGKIHEQLLNLVHKHI